MSKQQEENAIRHIQEGYQAIWWHPDDVKERAKRLDIKLSDEQADDILTVVIDNHDPVYGITWDSFDDSIHEYQHNETL